MLNGGVQIFRLSYEISRSIVGPMTAPATTDDSRSAPAGPAPGHRPARRPAVDWRIRFAVLSLIWGFSFLLIKVGTEGYAPLQVTLGRMVFGTAVLLAALGLRRQRLPAAPAPGSIWPSPPSSSTHCRTPSSPTPS